ncbi:MAG: hypothetical protein KGL39_55845 [Patescibacteria group bacterium]|nr:hypothetical protein [Patescibacteria group bacterium]
MRRATFLLPVLFLASCGTGIGYVASNYGVQVGDLVKTRYGEYKIWDKPDKNKMLVSPSVGQILSHPQSVNEGISVEGGSEGAAAREAANVWFKQQGRRCKILTTIEVAHPEFENTYTCD